MTCFLVYKESTRLQMINTNMKTQFLKCALLLSLLTLSSAHWGWGERYKAEVKIVNSLPDNLDLTIHCKSKDDDLGEHILRPGMVFQWRFKPNIWGTTQYYCSFQWFGSDLKWFDVYIEKRNDHGEHKWLIKKEGPCLYDLKCYNWNPSV